jgi:rod shape-determining protein MreD
MRFLATVALALGLLSLESVLVKYLDLSVTRVDVTVVLIVYLAIRANTLEGAFSSYAVGWLLDLMSGHPTGLYTFLGVLTFLLVRLAGSLVDVRTPATFLLFVVGADLGHGLLAAFFTWLASQEGAATALTAIPGQLALTALAALALYPLLRRLGLTEERRDPGLLR